MRKLICAVALVTACGGTTEPVAKPLTIAISGGGSATGHSATINSQQYYQCTYSFAVAVDGGSSLDDGTWESATIDYRLNSNGQTATQTALASDLQDWFGIDRLLPGARLSAIRNLAWSGPFTATVTFRYTIYRFPSIIGESHSEPIRVVCL